MIATIIVFVAHVAHYYQWRRRELVQMEWARRIEGYGHYGKGGSNAM